MSDIIFTKKASGSTPSAGRVGLYSNTDGKVYQKDSAGVEIALVNATGTETLTNKTILATKEVKVAVGASNLDLSTANVFTRTITTATTLTVSNTPSTGTAYSFVLDLTNGGAGVITWWTGMKWAGGTAPTLTAAGRDMLGFITHDGGTTWSGFVLGKDIK